MDLPSFLWLWRIAAWSMGLTLALYSALAIVGGTLRYLRRQPAVLSEPPTAPQLRPTLRRLHITLGLLLVVTVLLLLTIGIVGTLGQFGSLGHSLHLPVGLGVVGLTLLSAWSGTQITHPQKPWARSLHLTINGLLLLALAGVSWTGWIVVQKYLP